MTESKKKCHPAGQPLFLMGFPLEILQPHRAAEFRPSGKNASYQEILSGSSGIFSSVFPSFVLKLSELRKLQVVYRKFLQKTTNYPQLSVTLSLPATFIAF